VRLTEDGLEGAPHRIEWWVGASWHEGERSWRGPVNPWAP